jgi:hypothetical protein
MLESGGGGILCIQGCHKPIHKPGLDILTRIETRNPDGASFDGGRRLGRSKAVLPRRRLCAGELQVALRAHDMVRFAVMLGAYYLGLKEGSLVRLMIPADRNLRGETVRTEMSAVSCLPTLPLMASVLLSGSLASGNIYPRPERWADRPRDQKRRQAMSLLVLILPRAVVGANVHELNMRCSV